MEVVDVVRAVHEADRELDFRSYGLSQRTLACAGWAVEEVAPLVRNGHFGVPGLAVNEVVDVGEDAGDEFLVEDDAFHPAGLLLLGHTPVPPVVLVDGDRVLLLRGLGQRVDGPDESLGELEGGGVDGG